MSPTPQPVLADPVYMSLSSAARYLGVSPETIDRLVRTGELPAYRLGQRGHKRVRTEDVKALMRPVEVDQ